MKPEIEIAKNIINNLALSKGDCAFVFGSSISSKARREKLQQIRYFDESGILTDVEFKIIGEIPDIDMRIISPNPDPIRQKLDDMANSFKSDYLVEIKADSILYPESDIRDQSYTSFFRRVFLETIYPTFGQSLIDELVKLSHLYAIQDDYDYIHERLKLYQTAREILSSGSTARWGVADILCVYPTYLSQIVVDHEKLMRKQTPMQLLGNTHMEPWVEITKE